MKKGYLLLCLALILALGMTGAAAEALDLPDNVLIIEEEAFLNCTSLVGTLELPEGIVTIGPSAFAGCTGLTGVPWIPDSVTAIGAHAFAGCTGLSGTLYLPEAMEVDDTAFENCPGLTVIRGAAAPIHVALILDGPTDGGDMNADCYKAASAWCADRGYDLSVVAAGEGAVDEAVAEGGNVIVMLGFMQAGELADGAASYPDAKFIGVDIASGDLDGAVPDNVFLVTYREEQAGFMAGYAAVKLGYRHLGFLGGMDIPAVNRYGYGFVQGADAAAGEMGVANDVRVEFGYANSFAPTPEITDHMRRWYDAMGVEVVFACGGGIWGSVGGAIAETGKGKLIGVDIDQAAEIDGVFGAGTAVTSAMKNTGATMRMALDVIDAGDWATLGGTEQRLGVVSANPDENHVGLAPSTQFGTGFTRSDYEALTAGLYNGAWTVSDSLSGVGIDVRTADPTCVAVITDAGGVEDGGFNQAAYEGALGWCAAHDSPVRAYIADVEDADDALDTVAQAVYAGFDALVMPGFGFAGTIAEAQHEFPGVRFIGLDISGDDLDGGISDNVFLATYREEQAGFMAGYAAVKLGYRHLGFIGGMEFDSVMRYGYGFVQGADAAAVALSIADDVAVEFGYADAFWPSDELTDRMKAWYAQGVEVIFSCGGGICASVAEAARDEGGMVIGVDVDQASMLGEAITLTSAVKDLGATASYALGAIDAGNWAALGGAEQRLGVVSADPDENHVGLAPSTRFGEGFTRSDYEALTAGLYNGVWTVSDSTGAIPATQIAVNRQE